MMYFLALFMLVSASALAKPLDQTVSVTQDTLGNYKFAYNIKGISRHEERQSNGDTKGDFSYTDPDGGLKKVEYTAGVKGFQAVGAHLPAPVQDTPEVAKAKAEHLTALKVAELAAPKKTEKEVVQTLITPQLPTNNGLVHQQLYFLIPIKQ